MDFSSNAQAMPENTGNMVNAEATVTNGNAVTVDLVKSGSQEMVQSTGASLMTARENIKQQIIASGEAQKLSDTLSVSNPTSIVEFGRPVAEQLSKTADEVLRKQDTSTLVQTNTMMNALAKIMDKVDIGEIKELDKDPGFLSRLFNNAQAKLEKLMAKYDNVGKEIEKVCQELRKYEVEINQSNQDLEKLYANGVASYQELIKYVIAGECALDEIEKYRADLEVRAQTDPNASLELNNVTQAQQLLEQRVQDLRIAESVALQSLPIVKAVEFGNLNLSRKINSSFIVTIPVFKNAVTQAIMIKRQAIQAQAMKALDDKTNELLMKNAQNVANNMRMTAQLSGSSAIKMETIENSWRTIVDGINDTKAIQAELSKQREADKNKLEEIHNQFLSQVK